MARKKFYITDEEQANTKFSGWNVAKYIRLSRFDNDDVESYSVDNQRKLINSFIDEHEEFLSAEDFVDDDWTGTNFNRPSFQRMMEQIRQGNINCIILKDLSRFGRNYIEAGRLLEEVLPTYGCRVISIIDDVDSFKDEEATMSLMVRIKNLIHDQNSMDTSKKVRESKNLMRREGKNISPPPFGYIKDPNDKYKLIIDKEAAIVVKMIFEFYVKGLGVIRVAQKLNKLGIVTRNDYKKTGSIYKNDKYLYSKKGWDPNSIRAMLSNKTYMGTLDQRRKTTRNYKDRKEIKLEDKDHIIVHNNHEPIITKEIFEKIQYEFKNRCINTSKFNDKIYPFSGMLRCADCGSPMIRNSALKKEHLYVYYKCKAFNRRGMEACSRSHSIPHPVLTDIVIQTLNTHIKSLVDIRKSIESINNNNKKIQQLSIDYSKLINEKVKQRDDIKLAKTNAHMRYFDLLSDDDNSIAITKEDLANMINALDKKLEVLNDQISSLEIEKQSEEDILNNDLSWLDVLLKHGNITKLTREITTEFIDFIYISAEKKVKIDLKYRNEFDKLVKYKEKYSLELYLEGQYR